MGQDTLESSGVDLVLYTLAHMFKLHFVVCTPAKSIHIRFAEFCSPASADHESFSGRKNQCTQVHLTDQQHPKKALSSTLPDPILAS